MVGRVVRAGGAMLAAVSIVAGAAVSGAGAAGAASWWEEELQQILRPPCEAFPLPGQICYSGDLNQWGSVANFDFGYHGSKEYELGKEGTFFVGLSLREDVRGQQVTSITHQPPPGFEFVGVDMASVTIPGWKLGESSSATLDVIAEADPVTGVVTLTAPAGSWVIPAVDTERGLDTASMYFSLRYRPTEYITAGESGFTFTGTDVPATDGWLATNTHRVLPLGGTGSAGS